MKKYIAIAADELDTYFDYTLFSVVSIFLLGANSVEVGILGCCYAAPSFFVVFLGIIVIIIMLQNLGHYSLLVVLYQ